MEFVVPLIKTDNPAQHFKYAFDACALASLGNRVGPGNDFEKVSLGHYTKALSATFAALRDSEHATSDATLGAVLLLGLFENITAKQLGMLAWGSHIEGAIQLVKARGKQQLKTKVGLAMFVAVRTQMVCIGVRFVKKQQETNTILRLSIPLALESSPSWELIGGLVMPSRTSMRLIANDSISVLASCERRSIGS